MVVINSSDFASLGLPQSGTQVSIDGYEWYVKYNPSGSRGWPYTQYALAEGSAINSVSGLNMANFYADAISNGDLPAGQYLTDIGAGNEIWANGVGLSTTNLLISGLLRLGPGRPRGSMGRAGRLAGQGGVWPLMLSGRFWRP
jgi:hypothetical protein